jgi:hypothetical protein
MLAAYHANYLFILYTIPFRFLTFCVFAFYPLSSPAAATGTAAPRPRTLLEMATWELAGALFTLYGAVVDFASLQVHVTSPLVFPSAATRAFLASPTAVARIIELNPVVASFAVHPQAPSTYDILDKIPVCGGVWHVRVQYQADIVMDASGWTTTVRAPLGTRIASRVTFAGNGGGGMLVTETSEISARVLLLHYVR